jgi:4,5-DOPA dioxygenase extradiol
MGGESMNKMPVAFVGHGSPMNAIEDNTFSRGWRAMVGVIPQPKAILVVSAHWFVRGTRILDDPAPKTTYDMYGFPEELYQIVYKAAGAPDLARHTAELLRMGQVETRIDNSWGFDHGTWSVLNHMYPNRDIPVFQISVDSSAPGPVHFKIGQLLSSLREAGVLIIGSGNIVHNLRLVDWSKPDGGFDWADAFDQKIHDLIVDHSFESVVNAGSATQSGFANQAGSAGLFSKDAQLSIPTPDHFFPLLYVLGACDHLDAVHVFNDARVFGSISMTSYLFSAD